MLLFILGERCKKGSRVEFQYISCYCLSCCFNSSSGIKKISIHLMLLFIGVGFSFESIGTKFQYISCYCLSYAVTGENLELVTFQYISCYCLSTGELKVLKPWSDFNTSHVTVYQGANIDFEVGAEFQYISCYCLSWTCRCYRLFGSAFQYISCYCLSQSWKKVSRIRLHFNTSHVTVYPYSCTHPSQLSLISIHLMLLFIVQEKQGPKRFFRISIHLMLLFIAANGLWCCFNHYFNTSHVTVYRPVLLQCIHHRKDFNTSHVTVYLHGQLETLRRYVNFNTSHVTVYQIRAKRQLVANQNFNTSHVTVYLLSKDASGIIQQDFNTSHVTVYPN